MKRFSFRLFARETPIVGRRVWPRALLVAAVCVGALPVRAQPASPSALTEADVIEIARRRAPGSVVADAEVALADARERTAGLLPNPRVGWDREALPGDPGSSQDVVRATLPIDIAGPRAQRSLVASESAWTRAEASLARTDAVLEAVLAYYEVVALQERVVILEQAVADLDEAARVLGKREAAGTASGYESARLAVALELARSQVAEVHGELAGARARLAGLLELDIDAAGGLRVAGALDVAALPSADELLQRSASTRAVLAHARSSAQRAAQAEQRARRTWLPTLELSGGANLESDAGARRAGYVLGVSLSVPIFDHGQAVRAQAQAQRALSQARSEALARSLASDLSAAYATYTAARAELERFDAATSEQVEVLLRAAHSGYREGQRTIVELLDAQRARTEVLERRLELLAAAKRAEVRVRATGGLL